MKKKYGGYWILIWAATMFCMDPSTVIAKDKVVVIPLGGAQNYMYWQGLWTVDADYKIGDGVQYEGSSYVCVEAHRSEEPPSVNWNLLASKGADGVPGADGADGAPGADGADGAPGDDGADGAPGADGADGTDGLEGSDGLNCWDLDGDGIADNNEDINSDGSWNASDCQGAEGPVGVSPNQICLDGHYMIGLDGNGDILCSSHIVFVTSTTHTGNLGGLSGGDTVCQNLADAAGLDGTYKAWLSDINASPATRFTHPTSPYVLTTGQIIANSWTDLTDGTLMKSIDRNENSELITDSIVWTGTATNGTVYGDITCNDWTSDLFENSGFLGRTNRTDFAWTNAASTACSASVMFYCFQQ